MKKLFYYAAMIAGLIFLIFLLLVADAEAVSYSGDCDSICIVTSSNYTIYLTEGTIQNWTDYNNTVWLSGTGYRRGLGIIYTDDFVFEPDETGTACSVTEGYPLTIDCVSSGGNGQGYNNWSFYERYIKLETVVTDDTYRVYSYFRDSSGNEVSFNGTHDYGGLGDVAAGVLHATGTAGFIADNSSSEATFFNWAFDQSIKNVADHNHATGDDWGWISVGRSSEISAGTPITNYYRYLEANESSTGIEKWLSVLRCFKANPNSTCREGGAPPVDTCTPPASGNYAVDCSDNCNWNTPDDIPGNVTMSGSGINTLSSTWSFTGENQYIHIGQGCTFTIESGGEFN